VIFTDRLIQDRILNLPAPKLQTLKVGGIGRAKAEIWMKIGMQKADSKIEA